MPTDPELLGEFRDEMATDARKAGDYLRETRQGVNLSEMTLGWFVYDILSELSSQDDALYHRFYRDGRDLQNYLRTTFRDHHDEEVEAIADMARAGRETPRMAARSALEVLCHIPDPDEPKEVQTNDRAELAGALATLQTFLQRTAAEIPAPED